MPIFPLMELQKTWVEHLQIPQDLLQAWKAEAPEDMPFLVWCLRENKISFKDYSGWAKNHYQLPVIRHEFFTNLTLSSEVDPQSWTPWMVPLGMWEGLTYVGCVIPPPDPEEGYVYLLADPNDLYQAFSKFDHPEMTTMTSLAPEQAESEEEIPMMPDGLFFSDTPPEVKLDLPDFNLPASEPAEEAPEPEEVFLGTATRIEIPQKSEPLTAITKVNFLKPLSGWWSEVEKVFAHAVLVQHDGDQLSAIWKNGQQISGVEFSSTGPSLFRIALRTKKPYHGFVVENPTHTEFFESVGIRTYPSSVSAFLIESNPEMIVLYFGYIAEEGAELRMAEAFSENLTQLLNQNSRFKAA